MALRALDPAERKPDSRTEAEEARMDTRAARLDHLTTLNGQRQWAYRIGQFAYTGQLDAVLALCGELSREAVEGIEKLGRRK